MKILVFEYHDFGIEDVKETFVRLGIDYKVISDGRMKDRINNEFDALFAKEAEADNYDCVFTFNYMVSISRNCNERNIPYIALVYDSPQVQLYSYTIINPVNHVFIFDKDQYMSLKKEGINTVYYAPLCVNTDRMERMRAAADYANMAKLYKSDISFVGSMYNEKHNLYEKLTGINDFTRGYLNAIMEAQLLIYGEYFIPKLLSSYIIDDMKRVAEVSPDRYGVETEQYLYGEYFIGRKIANMERERFMTMLGKEFGENYKVNLYTPNRETNFSGVNNMGPVDYYTTCPYVFMNSDINLNISLRSIHSGIPLRGMDVMGAGAFLLSNYQADFYDFFVPGEDCVLYESMEDCRDKVEYYLKHDRERQQIADNGYGKVKEFHTFDIRIKELLEMSL